ncbi:VOC family protein [Klebsiella pneumoniae]|uniref:VOC family protein n=1 Tax=Klebsiella pneumoniae TaxID=573 RepID=UPI001C47E849|nr:VOC family protein [Klebsiella pneumoniae]
MFDHVKFGVSDYAASKAFFLQALAPLGVTLVGEGEPSYGAELAGSGDASLCLYQSAEKPALAAGGKDNGAPGLRPNYHASYYAAFVIAPDGHNIEAVCHLAG